ncbi:hypothetical protein EUGRSUZ_E00937 [Eucalyptus grandis]|uniref:Uncharacterized protein n=2 Tax=Eucalyptus grandis TaxID=71139 RepID=A0ACC3KP15_EUCGR|nr:hypothetical protein EUGRSUZ_E00937 [Eucalyptus grandis]
MAISRFRQQIRCPFAVALIPRLCAKSQHARSKVVDARFQALNLCPHHMNLQARALRHEASTRSGDVLFLLQSDSEGVSLDDVLGIIGKVSELCNTFSNSFVVLSSRIRIPQQAPDQPQLPLQVLDLALHAPQESGLLDEQLSYCLPHGRNNRLGHWYCTT